MKIAFVQCPPWATYVPPYHVYLLRSQLTADGHDVNVFDLNSRLYNGFSQGDQILFTGSLAFLWCSDAFRQNVYSVYKNIFDQFIADITQYKPEMFCFSILHESIGFLTELLMHIIKVLPDAHIIVGGQECFHKSRAIEVAKIPGVDAICQGEGELFLKKYVKELESNKKEIPKCKGFLALSPSGIIDNGRPKKLYNLDALEIPDYSHLDGKWPYFRSRRIATEATRGCINRCKFCNEAVNMRPYRKRSPDKIIAELKHHHLSLPQGNKQLEVMFRDSMINGDLDYLRKLCHAIIDSGIPIRWQSMAMVRDDMSYNDFELLAKSGCTTLSLGIESGCEKTIRRMDKKHTIAATEKMIGRMKAAGMVAVSSMLVGFPGENENDFLDSITKYFEFGNNLKGVGIFPFELNNDAPITASISAGLQTTLSQGLVQKRLRVARLVLQAKIEETGWFAHKSINIEKMRTVAAKFVNSHSITLLGSGKKLFSWKERLLSVGKHITVVDTKGITPINDAIFFNSEILPEIVLAQSELIIVCDQNMINCGCQLLWKSGYDESIDFITCNDQIFGKCDTDSLPGLLYLSCLEVINRDRFGPAFPDGGIIKGAILPILNSKNDPTL